MATEAFNKDFREILECLNAEGLNAEARSADELEQELRVILAAEFWLPSSSRRRESPWGRAAKMAGLPKVVFMDELSRLGISWINIDDEELEREFENA